MVVIATELRAGTSFTIQPFTRDLFTNKVILWLSLVSTPRALTCWGDDGLAQGGIASLSGYFEHYGISRPAVALRVLRPGLYIRWPTLEMPQLLSAGAAAFQDHSAASGPWLRHDKRCACSHPNTLHHLLATLKVFGSRSVASLQKTTSKM